MAHLSRLSHRDLILWHKAMDLAVLAYQQCSSLPRHEIFGLGSQLRRAATSIPSNIAEGCSRTSANDYLYFLSVARGSLAELETQFLLAQRIGYLNEAESSELQRRIDEVGRILHAVVASQNRRRG
jgi:four helix bundle protein